MSRKHMQVANNVNARRIIDGVARLTQQDRQWQTSDNVVAARHERDVQRYNEQRERERLRDRLQSIVDAFIVNN